MMTLKYTVIKSIEQYNTYCNLLEELVMREGNIVQDEIELLSLLIEKWDSEYNSYKDLNPIELLKALMKENNLIANDLVDILDLSKGTISKILNYNKGLSKDTIRKLSDNFKVSQEAFNRVYKLNNEENGPHIYTRLSGMKKRILEAR